MNQGDSNSSAYDNEALALLFRRASRMMARTCHRGAHAHHAQERVLSIIREDGPMKQSDLLEILDVRSSSLSEILRKLERNGWIERKRNEQDKRSFVISAVQGATGTPSGRRGGHRESADALFDCLDETERHQLGGLLRKIIGSLENQCLCRDENDGRCAFGMHDHRRKDQHGRDFGGWFSGRRKFGSPGGRGDRGGFRTGEDDES